MKMKTWNTVKPLTEISNKQLYDACQVLRGPRASQNQQKDKNNRKERT